MKPSLFEIFKIYFIIGLQLFGGGYVIYPLLKKYLTEDNKYMDEDKLVDYLALSQCLPGIIALNISIFSGYELRKTKGSIVASFGLILPSFLIIILIANLILNISDNKIIQDTLSGIRISVIVLTTYMILDIIKKTKISIFSILLFAFVLSASLFTKLSPTILVITSIIIAILYGVRRD